MAAVFTAVALVTRLPGLVAARAFNTDEATIATLGQTVLGPGTLYVDAADHKPPLVFAVYGLVQQVTGTLDLRPVRLVVVALVVAAALVAAAEARRRWGTTAAWVAGLVLVMGAGALGPADAQAANFEHFTLLPIVVAVAAGARGRPLVAGTAVAIAALVKQPAAITALPVAWALWRCCRFRGLGLAALAGSVTLVAVSAPFGLLRVLDWGLLRNEGYLELSVADLGHGGVRLSAMAGLALAFWVGALALVVAAGWRSPSGHRAPDPPAAPVDGAPARPPERDVDVWLLLVVSVVATVPGLRFFPHYLVQVVPAVALLAAKGASRRPRLVRPALAAVAGGAVVAGALAFYELSLDVAPPEQAVASYVRANTEADGKVFIWGNVPEIYWRAGRLPAGALTHNNLLTGYSGRRVQQATAADVADAGLYEEFVDRVRRDRPILVIDTAAAGYRGGDHFPLTGFPELERFVADHYERVATIDEVPIYRRLDAEARP
ncbi:hypothetical protein BH23ACT2_BH23ACT2_14100 [soil metagenome]